MDLKLNNKSVVVLASGSGIGKGVALEFAKENAKEAKEEVTEEDIAQVVSRWTGIPVTRLIEAEVKKLEKMDEIINKRVIGQEEAVAAVSNAIRRGRAGIADEEQPMGVPWLTCCEWKKTIRFRRFLM